VKYMLLMHYTDLGVPEISHWAPEDIKRHIGFMHTFNRELTESGELVDAQGLAGPDRARVVRATPEGPPAVTDGPFPETKELLAGFWVVDCADEARAVEIAARASTAPGPDNVPLNMPIEVRQIMAGPPEDL